MEPALSFIELCRAASYDRHWDIEARQIRHEICNPSSSFHKKYTTFCDTADWNRIFEFRMPENKAGSTIHIGYDNGAENTEPYYHIFRNWPNYKEVPLRERQRSAVDPDKAKQSIDMFYSVTSKRFYSKLLLFWDGAEWPKAEVDMQKFCWRRILKIHKLTPLCIICNKKRNDPFPFSLVFSYSDGAHTNVCYSPSGIDPEITVKIAVAAFMRCLEDQAPEKRLIKIIEQHAVKNLGTDTTNSVDPKVSVEMLGHFFDRNPTWTLNVLAVLDNLQQNRLVDMIQNITNSAYDGLLGDDLDLFEIARFIGKIIWALLPDSIRQDLYFELTRQINKHNRGMKTFTNLPGKYLGADIFDDLADPPPFDDNDLMDYDGTDTESTPTKNHRSKKKHYKVSQQDVFYAASALAVLDTIYEFQSLITDYLLSAPYLYFGAIPTYFPKALPCASVWAPPGLLSVRLGMYQSVSFPCEFTITDASRAASSSIERVLQWARGNSDSPSPLRELTEIRPTERSEILGNILGRVKNLPEYPISLQFSRDMPAIESVNRYTPDNSLFEFHKIISSAPALAPVLFGLLYYDMYKFLAMRRPKASASAIQSPFFVLPAEFATRIFPDPIIPDFDLPFTKRTLGGQEQITRAVTANLFRYFSVRWYVFEGAPRTLNEKECLLLLRSAKTVILSNAVPPPSFTCLPISCALPANSSLHVHGALLRALRTQIYAFLNTIWLSDKLNPDHIWHNKKAGSLSGFLDLAVDCIKKEKGIPTKWRAYSKPAVTLAMLLDMMENAPDGAQNPYPGPTFINLLLKGYIDGFRQNSVHKTEHKRQVPSPGPVSLSTFRKYLRRIKICRGSFEEFCAGGYIAWEYNGTLCLDYKKYWDDYLRDMGITAPRCSEGAFRRKVLAPYCVPGSNTEKNFRYDFRYTDPDSGKKYSFLRLKPSILASPDTVTE